MTQSNSTKVVGCNDDDDDDDDDDGDDGGSNDGDEWTYLVPIVFHNLSLYDGHFVLQFFRKEYTEYTTRKGTKAYANVGVIPLNGESNMLLKIGNIVFVNSCQFLATSLDNLVKALRKSGVDKFATLRHFSGEDDAYFEKGCYPYEYMTDETKLNETELPPNSACYNRLVGKDLDDEQYERAKQLWTKRGITTLHDWHHFYLLHNVLLLADIFEAFRHTMIDVHGLDCLHFPSLHIHDVAARVESYRRQVGVDNRSGDLSHDRICHSRWVKLRRAALHPRQLYRDVRLSCRLADVAPAVPRLQLCIRRVRCIRYRSADSAF